MAEQDQTLLKLLPAPIGGWNARDPLHAMPEGDAIEMINYWPDTANVMMRGGLEYFFGGDEPNLIDIWGLSLSTPSVGSTSYSHLFVAAYEALATPKIYRIDLTTKAATDVTGTVNLSGNFIITTTFANKTFCFSQATIPFDVGESGNAASSGWTGLTGSGSQVITGAPYKGRMYLVEFGSQSVFYGGLLAVTGAMTEVPLGTQLHKGGYIVGVSSASQSGDSNQDLFVVFSSKGEVLVFQGDYPGADTWSLIGRFYLSESLGYKSMFTMGGELFFLTATGIVGLNTLIQNERTGTEYATLTDKIKNYWVYITDSLRINSYINSQTWNVVYAPYHNMLLVRSPGGGGGEHYFAMNTLTQAWTKFEGLNITRMLAIDNRLFMASIVEDSEGFKILEFSKHGSGVNYDYQGGGGPSTVISASCRQAFSYLDDPAHTKHITSIKPLFELTQGSGHSQVTRSIKLGVDTDFEDLDTTYELILQDITANGTVNYNAAQHVAAEGTTFALLYNSQFGGGYILKWNAFIIAYESGGFLS